MHTAKQPFFENTFTMNNNNNNNSDNEASDDKFYLAHIAGRKYYPRIEYTEEAVDRVTLFDLLRMSVETVPLATIHHALSSREMKKSFIQALLKALELNNLYTAQHKKIEDIVRDIARGYQRRPRDALDEGEYQGNNCYHTVLIRTNDQGLFECDDEPTVVEYGICQGCLFQVPLETKCPFITNRPDYDHPYNLCRTIGPKKEFWTRDQDMAAYAYFRNNAKGLNNDTKSKVGKFLIAKGNSDPSCDAYCTGYKLQLDASMYVEEKTSVILDTDTFFRRYEAQRLGESVYYCLYKHVRDAIGMEANQCIALTDKWCADREDGYFSRAEQGQLEMSRNEEIHAIMVEAQETDTESEEPEKSSDSKNESEEEEEEREVRLLT